MIQFVCPRCGTIFEVRNGKAGQPARCPDCRHAGIGRPVADFAIDADFPSTEDLGPPISPLPSGSEPISQPE
ncbi:MAG: hypothetical protein ACJ8F7_10660 [Gemmataceae bacterium]